MKCLSLYPNVPLTVLQRKGTEGAEVHVANPKSHSYKLTKTIRITPTGCVLDSPHYLTTSLQLIHKKTSHLGSLP